MVREVENPSAPQCYQWNEQPQLDVQVNIAADKIAEDVHEVTLKVTCSAKTSQGTLYLMCGGKRGVFNRVRPILEALSVNLRYIGTAGQAAQVRDEPGMGLLVNQSHSHE